MTAPFNFSQPYVTDLTGGMPRYGPVTRPMVGQPQLPSPLGGGGPGPLINTVPPPGVGGGAVVDPGSAAGPTLPTGQPAQYGAITPGNNLVGTSILPSPSPDTTAARGDVSKGLAGLQTAPDRGTLAQQTFQELSAQSEPDYQAALRAATQAGAAGGQLGSGMLTEALTSDPYGSTGLGLQRQKYLGNLSAELATSSAGQTLQDRLNQLSAGQGVLGQLSGLDQQALQNLTGERGYESGLSEQAFQNNLQQNEMLASLGGFGSVTPQTLYGQGADLSGQGGSLLAMLLQNQKQPQSYDYGSAAPGYEGWSP